jgi:signal transduction histidine kinase
MNPRIDDSDSGLASVVHELRQPLTAIVAAARLVRTSDDEAAVDRARTILERQALYMQALLNRLADDARNCRSDALLQLDRIDVCRVVGDVLDANEMVFAEHRLEVTTVMPEQPVWIDGDTVRLQEILWNLIANAVRYTPPGGQIVVRVALHEHHVFIAVRDTGSGLRPGEMHTIFGSFSQGDCGHADGLGLGLAVAREFARAHGGTIDVRSEGRGRGCEFTLVLPSPALDVAAADVSY